MRGDHRYEDQQLRSQSSQSKAVKVEGAITSNHRDCDRHYRVDIINTKTGASVLSVRLTKRQKADVSTAVLGAIGHSDELYS